MIIAPNSASATSMKTLKPITDLPYLNNDQISDIALSGKNIFLTGTTESPNSNWITGLLGGSSDGFLISYAVTGVQNWGLRLGNENSEIATSVAIDQDGSIWVVGAGNAVTQTTQPNAAILINCN